MLCAKNKLTILVRTISIVLVNAIILSGIAFAIPESADYTVAAPNSFDPITGDGLHDELLEGAFQNAALFRDISILIGQYLHLGISEHTLIPMVKQHIDAAELASKENHPGTLLEEHKIGEARFDKEENAFYLPVYKDGLKVFQYKFYINENPEETPDKTIPIGDGKNVYIKKEMIASFKEEAREDAIVKESDPKESETPEIYPLHLEDGAKIVVVGGGPAGSFFAIEALRKAREQGRQIEVTIIEKKKELQFYPSAYPNAHRAGCNFCAGGISPKMSDILRDCGLVLPKAIVQGKVKYLTVQGHWKNMELMIPKEREMLLVYRGASPAKRTDRAHNFDSFLLSKAIEEGAKVITGDVEGVEYSSKNKPLISYKAIEGSKRQDESMEADFVVFAGGVNPAPGMKLEGNKLFKSIEKMFPGFIPPKVRKTLIFELEGDEESMRSMEGQVYFMEYGSKDLKIEMSSLIPKGRFITVVLIGPSIDNADTAERLEIIKKFLALPHMKRILPKKVKFATVCICNPNMTIGAAKNPFGHRAAIIGDMVTARLYKDGILSAHITASSLANSMFDEGIDADSLKKGYWPTIKEFETDTWFGRLVFMMNRWTFGNPILSRILYQAVIMERKNKNKKDRRLENILWKIASGDDTYKNIFKSMLHPKAILSILTGGVLITIRNYLTELIFGLDWRGFGRYPTGVYKQALFFKRQQLRDQFDLHQLDTKPEFEELYTIKIRASRERILRQLGKFGDKDRGYLKPRMISVGRVHGSPNEKGSIIKYEIIFK